MNRKQRHALAKAITRPGSSVGNEIAPFKEKNTTGILEAGPQRSHAGHANRAETSAIMFSKAVQYLQSGQLEKAETSYHDLLAHDPNHVAALHHLGLIALNRRQFDRAAKFIGDALVRKQDYAEAYNNFGIVRREQD